MTRAELSRYIRRQQQKCEGLVRAEGDTAHFVREVERLNALKTLARLRGARLHHDWYVAVFLSALCVFIAGVLLHLRVDTTKVDMTVTANSVDLALKSGVKLDFRGKQQTFLVQNVSGISEAWAQLSGRRFTPQDGHLRFSELGINAKLASLSLTGPKANLSIRRVNRGTFLLLATGHIVAGIIALEATGASLAKLSGEPMGSAKQTLIFDGRQHEFIEFRAIEPALRLVLTLPNVYRKQRLIAELSADAIHFRVRTHKSRRVSDYVSSISSGSVKFKQRGVDPVTLEEEEDFEVLSFSGSGEVEFEKESLVFQGEGTVVDLRYGSSKRSIMPSLLMVWWKNDAATLFWAAAGTIWVLGWGIRRTIFT